MGGVGVGVGCYFAVRTALLALFYEPLCAYGWECSAMGPRKITRDSVWPWKTFEKATCEGPSAPQPSLLALLAFAMAAAP